LARSTLRTAAGPSRIASLLGVRRVVAMSGSPAAHDGGRYPSWVVNPWDSQYLTCWTTSGARWPFPLEGHQAGRVTRTCGVHRDAPAQRGLQPRHAGAPGHRINATHVGAEMDPSHLFWQGIDPVAAIEHLGELVYHAAAKEHQDE